MSAGPSLQVVVRAVARAFWFGLLPVGVAAAVLRYGVASLFDVTASTIEQSVAGFFRTHAMQATVAMVLVVALWIRYWQWHLPGAFLLSRLPWRVSRGLGVSALAEREFSAVLVDKVRRATRDARGITPPDRERLEEALAATEAACHLRATAVDEVRVARQRLLDAAEPLIARAHRRDAVLLGAGLAISVVVALSARDTVGRVYEVSGGSMLPTFEPEMNVAVNRWTTLFPADGRSRAVRRGDVVVFRRDLGEGVEHLIKRVVGLPGDHVRMDGLAPIINGWTVPNCRVGVYTYARGDTVVTGWLRVEFLEDRAYLVLFNTNGTAFEKDMIVDEGEVFVLGDNRADSRDSRSFNAGFGGGQPIADITGRVDWLLWSPGRDGRFDFHRIFEPLGTELVMDGVDVTKLREGIASCLTQRPLNTTPPPPPAAATHQASL